MRRAAILIATAAALAACAEEPDRHLVTLSGDGVETAQEPAGFQAPEFGFALEYPPDHGFTHDFQRGDPAPSQWKAFAPAESRGEPVAAVVLPGSGRRAGGEMRVGVSTEPDGVATCLELPRQARPDTRTEVFLDGVPFMRFDAEEEQAVGGRTTVRAHRAVHNDHCYAIDLVATSSERGQDEEPGPEEAAAFTHEEAWQRLQELPSGFRFIRTFQGAMR